MSPNRSVVLAMLLLLTCCLVGCGKRQDLEPGWVDFKGERFALPHVIAVQQPVDDEIARSEYAPVAADAKSVVWLVMSERPLPQERALTEPPRRLFGEQHDTGRGIAIRLGPGGAFLTPVYMYMGKTGATDERSIIDMRSQTGRAGYPVVLAMRDGRVTGRLVKDGKSDDVRWNLPFDVAIQNADPAALEAWGTPLPPNGGEVGAALERDLNAMRDRDLKAILAYGASPYPELATAPPDAQQRMLDGLRDDALAPTRVIGGLQRDDSALLIHTRPVRGQPKLDDLVCVHRFQRTDGVWRNEVMACFSS